MQPEESWDSLICELRDAMRARGLSYRDLGTVIHKTRSWAFKVLNRPDVPARLRDLMDLGVKMGLKLEWSNIHGTSSTVYVTTLENQDDTERDQPPVRDT